jgi:hypothetical protein
MNEEKYFLHQIKHTSDVYDKGIVVKDTLDGAKQSYHAYLGAYAYDHDTNTDFVSVFISDTDGVILMAETWKSAIEPNEE